MNPSCTDLTGAESAVRLLKISGYRATVTMTSSECIKSSWSVGGHEWEIRCFPSYRSGVDWVALQFVFLGEAQAHPRKVRATLSCRLVDPSGSLEPSEEKSASLAFSYYDESSSMIYLVKRFDTEARSPRSGSYLRNDSVTVQCTITVLKDLVDDACNPSIKKDVPLPVPSSNLHQHFDELLKSKKGADVTFALVSGERFPAHRIILAARSPVFMAEFFGHMEESSSQVVVVRDMEPAAFKAMLRFIYTDTAPELDGPLEAVATMAQHLLAAADRYGLDRLKLICEAKLCGGIDVGTAATTLALAEQHSCSLLKARCVEFITASPESLDAVLATEGYAHLAASCPLVLAELLKAARGRKNN